MFHSLAGRGAWLGGFSGFEKRLIERWKLRIDEFLTGRAVQALDCLQIEVIDKSGIADNFGVVNFCLDLCIMNLQVGSGVSVGCIFKRPEGMIQVSLQYSSLLSATIGIP